MRFYFLFFIFLILSAGLLSAVTLSGSPSSLNFNLDVGEEKCLIFLVSSNDYSGDLDSIMKWAEKDTQVSSMDDYNLDSSEIELSVSYSPEAISDFDGEEAIQVCISGNEEGYWKGILNYMPESEGNSAGGIGTVLKVNITDIPDDEQTQEEQTPPSNPNDDGNSGGGGGSSGGSSSLLNSSETINTTVEDTKNNETQETPLGELEEETSEQGFGITGAVTGFVKTKTGKGLIGIVLVIIFAFAGIKIYKRKFTKE